MIIQSGFRVPYTVKETPDKGRGVFAEAPLNKGDILWRFVPGQYAVYDERTFLAAIKGMSKADIAYELTHAFGMKEFPDYLIRISDDGVLINHADDANTATQSTLSDEQPVLAVAQTIQDVTKALLGDRYALIALRDIAAGEELTNNYEIEVADPPFYLTLCDQYGVDEDYLEAE